MRGQSARILITGADIVGISTYVKVLQMEGYEVYTAFSSSDLLDILSQHSFDFDLIITDVRITGITLYELSDYIAMNSGGESIPMMGMAEFPKDEEIMMESGESFDLVIEKGFSSNELLDAIDSIVNIDTSLGEGMSEQQIKHRAQELSDTSTVPLNQEGYMEAAQNYVQNKGHQSLIDQFKDM